MLNTAGFRGEGRPPTNRGAPTKQFIFYFSLMIDAFSAFSAFESTDSPDCLPILLSISVFSLYSSCSPLLVFLAVD